MAFSDEENIRATLFYHLRKKRIIGAKHTSFDNLKFGFPSHLGKEVLKVAKDLVKQGYLITKPTSYGLQVSLNKNRIKEIEDFIKKVYGIDFDS
jgi:hypothetical protein